MPEMQKPVLEHAAPKANQNQGLDGHLADEATALMQIEAFSFVPPPLSSRFGQEARWHPNPTSFLYAIQKDERWMWTTAVTLRPEQIRVIRYQK